jgi:hypothetical protein
MAVRGGWGAARTAALLAGIGVSSALMVNLPGASLANARSHPHAVASYLAASDTWISLGRAGREDGGIIPASAVQQPSPEPIEVDGTNAQSNPAGVQLTSLGRGKPRESVGRSLSGGAVQWRAASGCLNATLRRVISEVSAKFGPVTVSSTCRSRQRNAGVGGARSSRHLTGDAVDFRVGGNMRAELAFLGGHRAVGGLKRYADGHIHIDTGPRRNW